MGGAFRLWLLLLAALFGAAQAEAACMAETFEGNDYTVCRFDLRHDHTFGGTPLFQLNGLRKRKVQAINVTGDTATAWSRWASS